MSEEKKEPWLNYLALTTVILAVCATLATFKGGSYSTRSVMSQNQASDQWAFFQAKSIKGSLLETAKDRLELDLSLPSAQSSKGAAEAFKVQVEGYTKEIERYNKEKAGIKARAEEYERIRDISKKHSQAFGYAVIFLQIAILLSSVAALLKLKKVWFLALATGLFGIIYFINGFFLFMSLG